MKRRGYDAFSISQHYLTHVTDVIKQLGPLRFISARPLERTIGEVKKLIKSNAKPKENAENVMIDHYSNAYMCWQDNNCIKLTENYVSFKLEDFLLSLPTTNEQHTVLSNLPDNTMTVNVYESYVLRRTNQTIKFGRSFKTNVILREKNQELYQLANIKTIYGVNDRIFALIQKCANLKKEGFNYCYMSTEQCIFSLEVVEANTVCGMSILIPSIIDKNKIYVSWKFAR
jgi:hypothetical protein